MIWLFELTKGQNFLPPVGTYPQFCPIVIYLLDSRVVKSNGQ